MCLGTFPTEDQHSVGSHGLASVPTPPLARCVILSKSLHLSKPPFPHLGNGLDPGDHLVIGRRTREPDPCSVGLSAIAASGPRTLASPGECVCGLILSPNHPGSKASSDVWADRQGGDICSKTVLDGNDLNCAQKAMVGLLLAASVCSLRGREDSLASLDLDRNL